MQLADGGFQRPPLLPSREGRAHGLRPRCPSERHFHYEAPGAAHTVRAGCGRFTSWGEKGPQSPRGALGPWPPGRELTPFPARSNRRARGSPQNWHPGSSRFTWQEEHVGLPEGSGVGGENGGGRRKPHKFLSTGPLRPSVKSVLICADEPRVSFPCQERGPRCESFANESSVAPSPRPLPGAPRPSVSEGKSSSGNVSAPIKHYHLPVTGAASGSLS